MFSVLPKGMQLYSGRACPHALNLRTYTQHTTWPPRDQKVHVAGYTHRRFLWLGKNHVYTSEGWTDREGDLFLQWTSVYAARFSLTSCRKLH